MDFCGECLPIGVLSECLWLVFETQLQRVLGMCSRAGRHSGVHLSPVGVVELKLYFRQKNVLHRNLHMKTHKPQPRAVDLLDSN